LRKSIRKLALEKKHKDLVLSIIESVENAGDDVQVRTNLVFFLKTVLINQDLACFEKLFNTTQPKEKLRDLMDNSPSEEIKDLFSILYSQIVREYGEKDVKAKIHDEKNELESVDEEEGGNQYEDSEDGDSDASSWNYEGS
jgi:hypothetical protein